MLTGTLMFTDIEGSTVLAASLGDVFPEVISAHHRLLRRIFAEHEATELRTEGDAFFLLFPSAHDAATAAIAAQRALAGATWPAGVDVRVRMGLHSGTIVLVDGEHVGLDIHRAARIAASAHGGQIVASRETADVLRDGADVELVDLGAQWLKDLDAPEQIYQVLAAGLTRRFPPLRSLGTPTNLPAFNSALVGRAAERSELLDLLRDPATRLVTLVGPGGVGKTRLAAGVAEEATPLFPYGVYFVDLGSVTDPAMVPTTVAAAMNHDPPFDDESVAALVGHISQRRMLLLFDNFEQVLDAAAFVSQLLSTTDGPSVLVTSREPLRLRDEVQFAVPPLSLPGMTSSADEQQKSDAVALFLDRARRVRRDLPLRPDDVATIAEICRRLDGLPLAIELVAAQLKVLGPRALLTDLDRHLLRLAGPTDVPDRQQTLRAAIDWSYALLSEAEQRCFRRLSVFTGGFSVEAADAVLAMPATDPPVVEVLTGLVDKSLLRVDFAASETRFAMLNTVQAYAEARCATDPGAPAVKTAHARHFLQLAESADFDGPEQLESLSRFDADAENLRAAVQRAVDGDVIEPEGVGLRLAEPLGLYWYRRGAFREGARWLEIVLATWPQGTDLHRARVLFRLGVLRSDLGELAAAATALQEALELLPPGTEVGLAAKIHNSLGVTAMLTGDYPRARALLEESRRLRSVIGDEPGRATVLTNLASIMALEGDATQAAQMLEECLRLDRQLGNRWGEAVDQLNLAGVLLDGPESERPADLLADALTAFDELNDLDGIASCLAELARVAIIGGDDRRAARLAGAAQGLWSSIGTTLIPADQRRFDDTLAHLGQALEKDGASLQSQGRAMTPSQAVTYALRRQ